MYNTVKHHVMNMTTGITKFSARKQFEFLCLQNPYINLWKIIIHN